MSMFSLKSSGNAGGSPIKIEALKSSEPIKDDEPQEAEIFKNQEFEFLRKMQSHQRILRMGQFNCHEKSVYYS